jgi:hypothetical protein
MLGAMHVKTEWSAVPGTNSPAAKYVGLVEFQDSGEWHNFEVVRVGRTVVFGGCCNVGFLESGHIDREDGETLDECLSEMLADLETYYNDGPAYVSRIICSERM